MHVSRALAAHLGMGVKTLRL